MLQQPNMNAGEYAYQLELAELLHWFWSTNGGLLVLISDPGQDQDQINQRQVLGNKLVSLLQHFRGVVLEAQASAVSRTVVSWVLGKRT